MVCCFTAMVSLYLFLKQPTEVVVRTQETSMLVFSVRGDINVTHNFYLNEISVASSTQHTHTKHILNEEEMAKSDPGSIVLISRARQLLPYIHSC